MSSSLRDALKSAGVNTPARGPSKPKLPMKPHRPDNEAHYVVLPISKLRNGTIFVPIEKMGKTFYFNRTLKDGKVLHLSDRRWQITREFYIKWGEPGRDGPRYQNYHTGKDAIFALTDWAIVKVS